jgi:sialate O-acetylesterase
MSPYFREAQAGLLRIPNTGMVVTMDISEIYDIHPSNKHDEGDRFARLALINQYDIDIVSYGPDFKKAWKQNNSVYIEFDHIEEGLVLDNSLKNEFELAGEDQVYHPQ